MIRSGHAAFVLLLAFTELTGCSATPVGRACDLGGSLPAPTEVVVASPSLDCVSRTCLRYPANPGKELPDGAVYREDIGLCTAECSADDDCERVPESPCVSGFTCGIAVTVGPFCCRKFCICKDYVIVPESGALDTPLACDASKTENACCNLPGRVGDAAAYPLCNIPNQ
ncbi:MAG: hypothetical protein NT062_02750 [Proteobacteria bacterium]|nr:hypothetical protein [Pseudomonadota bacterium]